MNVAAPIAARMVSRQYWVVPSTKLRTWHRNSLLRSCAPILFRFAYHGRRRRVLEFQPVRRPARTITGAELLRHDPLEAHLAGVLEHGEAIRVFEMPAQANAWPALPENAGQCRLAYLDRSRRMSVPSSSGRSKANRKALASFRRCRSCRAPWKTAPSAPRGIAPSLAS